MSTKCSGPGAACLSPFEMSGKVDNDSKYENPSFHLRLKEAHH